MDYWTRWVVRFPRSGRGLHRVGSCIRILQGRICFARDEKMRQEDGKVVCAQLKEESKVVATCREVRR